MIQIKIKRALPKKIRSRIWVLRQSEDMLKNDSRNVGKKVETITEGYKRAINVDGTISFLQDNDSIGNFHGVFSNLKVPIPK